MLLGQDQQSDERIVRTAVSATMKPTHFGAPTYIQITKQKIELKLQTKLAFNKARR